ncbi:MAG: LON peptidase substrate-binding domain-containing protein [Gammaproteobacteria bacterium]
MQTTSVSLFPLNTVLYPGGLLPLRIFERRYVDMVRECLRADQPFGVVLIRSGSEVGTAATPETVGTFARIRDFDRGEGGLLNIVAQGGQRFLIRDRSTDRNELQTATVEALVDEIAPAVPEDLAGMRELLHRILERLGGVPGGQDAAWDDANWVGYRLAELLPLPLPARQRILEIHTAAERLGFIAALLAGAGEKH